MKMFTVVPDANPEALIIQTYETFSSVSLLLLDLADSLEDKQRHLAMAIYQMSEMGLMLAERSLDIERAIKPDVDLTVDAVSTVLTPSRAGPLPQGIWVEHMCCDQRLPLWERACSRWQLQRRRRVQAEAGNG